VVVVVVVEVVLVVVVVVVMGTVLSVVGFDQTLALVTNSPGNNDFGASVAKLVVLLENAQI